MIDQLKGRAYASISCKPTQLGIFESEAYCLENIRKVVGYAAPHGPPRHGGHGGPLLH